MSITDPEEKKESNSAQSSRRIDTGGGTYIEGGVNTGGGDFVGRDKIVHSGANADEIARAFLALYQGIEKIPDPADRAEALDTAKKLEAEARKGDAVDPNRVERWLKYLVSIAPDMLDVATATFTSPIAGVGKVFQKIAQKVKEENQK